MTTAEVANRLVELCRQGDYETCYKELFHDSCSSIEMAGTPWQDAHGMEAIHEKGKRFNDMVETMHGGSIGDPIVAGNHFACTMMMDVTMKGQERGEEHQICLYRVENGKVVSEQFFYPVPPA